MNKTLGCNGQSSFLELSKLDVEGPKEINLNWRAYRRCYAKMRRPLWDAGVGHQVATIGQSCLPSLPPARLHPDSLIAETIYDINRTRGASAQLDSSCPHQKRYLYGKPSRFKDMLVARCLQRVIGTSLFPSLSREFVDYCAKSTKYVHVLRHNIVSHHAVLANQLKTAFTNTFHEDDSAFTDSVCSPRRTEHHASNVERLPCREMQALHAMNPWRSASEDTLSGESCARERRRLRTKSPDVGQCLRHRLQCTQAVPH